jgi:hypothetical protein
MKTKVERNVGCVFPFSSPYCLQLRNICKINGLDDPIGCLDTPPIPKFDKLYKVFEHLFSLKRGV